MSGRKEREERAFEALIVSLLRKDCDPDKVKPEDLPKLTKKEKAALEALGPDLVDRLWNQARRDPGPPRVVKEEPAMARADEHGMNRAEIISEETAQEIRRHREEVLQRIMKQREAKTDG